MPDTDQQLKTFTNFLSRKNLRLTNQRKAILDAVLKTEEHYTAEELLIHARAIDDSVSRATVYRTLPILIDCDIIRVIDIGKDYKYYATVKREANIQAQIICRDCDKIFEIDAPFMDWYSQTAVDRLGLEVQSQRLQISAICKKVKNGETCANFA
jgi:Fur family ferric uptake transcriptional regulator